MKTGNMRNEIAAVVVVLGFLAGCYGMSTLRPVDGPAADGDISGDAGGDGHAGDGGDPPADGGTDVAGPPPTNVDVLVVMDDSASMAAEQTLFIDAFSHFIRSILSGPVRDLHVGVVSTDMGVGGYSGIESCGRDDPAYDPQRGDDGVLRNVPRGAVCEAAYPLFLSYTVDPAQGPDAVQIDKMVKDFGCIAALGVNGCGFEQPLEAARRALLPPPEGQSGPGGANAGFLREGSLLVVFFVSDEEDCSAADPTLYDVSGLPYSVNLQCFYQEPKLHGVDRYVAAFNAIRPDPENLVVGIVTGVPTGESRCNGMGLQLGGCLDAPLMQEVVQPEGDLLEYVCTYPAGCTPPDPSTHIPGDCRSEAFPGRRYVELASRLGGNAFVWSICSEDFESLMNNVALKVSQRMESG
jgi:hypothetical protein